MKDIEAVAFVLDTFYLNSFRDDLTKFSKNCVILVFNFKGEINLNYCGPGIKFSEKTWRFGKKNPFISYLVYFYQLIKILGYIFTSYRVNKAISENTYAAVIIGFFRLLNRCKKSYYIGVDWLATKSRKNFSSYLLSNIFFPVCDLIACRLNDVLLTSKPTITARYGFWKRDITKETRIFSYWKSQIVDRSYHRKGKKIIRNKIFFLGFIRSDSGFEIIIQSIKNLYSKYGIKIKIIGPMTQELKKILISVKKLRLENTVEYLGFINTNDFSKAVTDCFCGINLLTDAESYSKYTVPSKLVYYIQFLLPVITTRGAGLNLTELIELNRLGLVIDPNKAKFEEAAGELFVNHKKYCHNIIKFIHNNKKENFRQIFS